MPHLTLSLLGPLQAQLDAQPLAGLSYDKVRALLCYLAVETGPHNRDALCELLWPDQPAAAARRSLRVALTTLRHALGDQAAPVPFLLATRDSLQANPASDIALDTATFAELLRQTAEHQHNAGALCAECAERLRSSMELYRGEFLAGLAVRASAAFDEWVTLQRERLHRQALDALAQLLAYHEATGEDEQARQYAWRTLGLEAWDEAAHRCLMRVLAHKGQRSAALAQYERCRKVLADELGVEPSDETTALYEQIRSGTLARADVQAAPATNGDSGAGSPAATEALAVSANGSAPHTLPAQFTSFVGRARELANGAQQLAATRLLTLTGPGGTGKTRLSLQLAEAIQERFPDGVWLVELAPVEQAPLVEQALAGVLGVSSAPGRSLMASMTAYLRAKRALVLLDNCEHLIDACAQLAHALLASCSQLRILATSREPLRISGESIFSVPPLAVPEAHQLAAPEQLVTVEAVQLFVERARAVQAGFQANAANSLAIAQICQRLDGIPLAIELAASRLRILTVEQLAARLDDRFRLLTNGSRAALPRHQTLQALIDWSHNLLEAEEQALFRRLAVFSGGWALEAAEAICGEGLRSDVLDLLARLVDKSLVQSDARAGDARYRMLETIRQYAADKLAASGEATALHERHAEYFTAFAQRDFSENGNYAPDWLPRLDGESDNLQAVLAWRRTAHNPELLLQIALPLAYYISARRYSYELQHALEDALRYGAGLGHTFASAQACFYVAELRAMRCDYNAAQPLFERSLAMFRDLEGGPKYARALLRSAWQARERGDAAGAWSKLEESLSLYHQLGDQYGIIDVLTTMGQVTVMQEDPEQAERILTQASTLARENNAQFYIGWLLNHLGHVAQIRGNYDQAIHFQQQSLVAFRELLGEGSQGEAWVLHSLGETALALGDLTQAQAQLAANIVLCRDIGEYLPAAWCLASLGSAAALDGQAERAARIWGAAEQLRTAIGGRTAPAARATYERAVARARAALGNAGFAAAWAAGQALTLEQAIDEALQLPRALTENEAGS